MPCSMLCVGTQAWGSRKNSCDTEEPVPCAAKMHLRPGGGGSALGLDYEA